MTMQDDTSTTKRLSDHLAHEKKDDEEDVVGDVGRKKWSSASPVTDSSSISPDTPLLFHTAVTTTAAAAAAAAVDGPIVEKKEEELTTVAASAAAAASTTEEAILGQQPMFSLSGEEQETTEPPPPPPPPPDEPFWTKLSGSKHSGKDDSDEDDGYYNSDAAIIDDEVYEAGSSSSGNNNNMLLMEAANMLGIDEEEEELMRSTAVSSERDVDPLLVVRPNFQSAPAPVVGQQQQGQYQQQQPPMQALSIPSQEQQPSKSQSLGSLSHNGGHSHHRLPSTIEEEDEEEVLQEGHWIYSPPCTPDQRQQQQQQRKVYNSTVSSMSMSRHSSQDDVLRLEDSSSDDEEGETDDKAPLLKQQQYQQQEQEHEQQQHSPPLSPRVGTSTSPTRAAAADTTLISSPMSAMSSSPLYSSESPTATLVNNPSSFATCTSSPVSTLASLPQQNEQQYDANGNRLSSSFLSSPSSLSPSVSQKADATISPSPPTKSSAMTTTSSVGGGFTPIYTSTKALEVVSKQFLSRSNYYAPYAAATWIGFWALLHVTCANYVLTPMRDAIALAVGVEHMPKLTLASTVLAFCSSVPIGWLFEAPDPSRRRLWKRMGLTRGETQGSSLALFYRCFAMSLLSYAVGFTFIEWLKTNGPVDVDTAAAQRALLESSPSLYSSVRMFLSDTWTWLWTDFQPLWGFLGQAIYIAFFLVVHLMKLHSLSLVWGVTTEAMEYEEVARKRDAKNSNTARNSSRSGDSTPPNSIAPPTKTRLQRLALVGFGGTMGGILGSCLASTMARRLRLPGLLVVAAVLLEVSAELSIELGRIMQKHWEEEQRLLQTDGAAAVAAVASSNDLASLDTSMKRSASMGSMKRVASGNSLNRVKSSSELSKAASSSNLANMATSKHHALNTSNSKAGASSMPTGATSQQPQPAQEEEVNDNSFWQRLNRGVSTILRSRLLMSIFTYNALYASTTVLLSFQRAALVANRNNHSSSTEANTAFLANINMASSIAVFGLQASGLGAALAHKCGSRITLGLMPLIRLLGVLALAWWHQTSNGQPPNLLVFLVVDECCKIMNLAVAKPVRESLWRGLSNEARYEAKPIVDTLANRWGAGSAAFLVSSINKSLDMLNVEPTADGSRMIFGFPPILFLCIIIAGWWTAVSADLGQIRARIDQELKKRQ